MAAYRPPSYVFAANKDNNTLSPTNTGGAIVSWSVSPALPAGLEINQSNGSIGGTPTSTSPSTTYTVTATNTGGQATASVTVVVSAATPIVDGGLSGPVVAIHSNGNQIVSETLYGSWLLQSLPSGSVIMRGSTFCGGSTAQCSDTNDAGHASVDLVGGTLIDALSTDGSTTSGVEIRSASTGAVVATVDGSFSWYYLSTDGSYVCTGSSTSLTAWSTASGAMLASASGDFAGSTVICAPGEMLTADGPAGSNVVQAISVSTGASTTSAPFEGTFASWFADGSHFTTSTGTEVWVYSNAAAQVETVQLPAAPIGGWGNYFWGYARTGGALAIYEIGHGATPVQTVGLPTDSTLIQDGNTLTVLPFEASSAAVLSFAGGVSQEGVSIPVGDVESVAVTGSQWFVGNGSGVVYDGATSGYLTLGTIEAIAGGTSYFSVATASGQIFSYDSSTNTLVSTVNGGLTSQLISSASGAVMIASDFSGAGTVFSPASGATLDTVNSTGGINSIGLSASGTVFGGANGDAGTLVQEVGGGTILDDS